MTNEEKIEEIVIDAYEGWTKVGFTDYEMIDILSKLAEWKDQQFKEYLEKKKAELIDKAWKVFEKYATYMHPRKDEEVCKMTKYQFLKAMEEKK